MREIYVLTTKDIFCALGVFLLSSFGTVLIFINFTNSGKEGLKERKKSRKVEIHLGSLKGKREI
jgi:hypothetical protein